LASEGGRGGRKGEGREGRERPYSLAGGAAQPEIGGRERKGERGREGRGRDRRERSETRLCIKRQRINNR
jgi:hypothetical protein